MRVFRFKMRPMLYELEKYSKGLSNFDFSDIQQKLLKSILLYANDKTKYYKKLFSENNIDINNLDEFEKIPFLTKSIIKSCKNDIQSNELKKVFLYNMNTGGTTGDPLAFPVSSPYDSEHQKLCYRLFGYTKGDLIVCVDGTKIDKKLLHKNVFWETVSFRSLPYGKIAFSSVYLNNKTVHYYVEHLKACKPKIIRGYPSAINFIASNILENKIKLNFELKEVQLTAEVVLESQIKNIEKAFNCKVGMQYGHSEVSVFAYTFDSSYEYYCSPLYGYTEIINANYKHVKVGEVGEIVVTGFYNKALPFIRYRTGDLALYNGTKNGVTRLGRIYGREQDFLYDINGNRVYLIGIIYGGHNKYLNVIKEWQITQNEYGKALAKIIKCDSFTDDDAKELKESFHNNYKIEVNIKYVNNIELTKNGKVKFIIQNTA